MNSRLLRLKYARLTILKNKFVNERTSLQSLVKIRLSETLSIAELNHLEAKLRKTHKQLQKWRADIISLRDEILATQRQQTKRNASVTFSCNELIAHSDKPKTVTSDQILKNVRQDFQLQEIAENYLNTIQELFDSINYHKHQLQTKRIKDKFTDTLTAGIDMSKYNKFLINPALKTKFKHDPSYASQIKEINKEIIIRNAQTIAAINRDLFLNIPRSEILSPWKYNTSGVDLNLKAFSANFNAVAFIVKSSILDEDNIEKRTLAIEEWIWVANHLLHELHDYSGFQAICSALNSAVISRLKKSFNGLSNEAKTVWEHLKTVAEGELLRGELNKAMLNATQPSIPFLATFLKDFTYIKDGNVAANTSGASSTIKRERIEEYTAGGKKRIVEFDILQRELRKKIALTEINPFLKKQLNYVRETVDFENDEAENAEYERSVQLEPLGNDLKPATILELFRYEPSQPLEQQSVTIKQIVLQELISSVKVYLSHLQNEIPTILSQEIDWPVEGKKILDQQMRKDAYIAALKHYTEKVEANSLTEEAKLLINQLQDFFQINVHELERQVIEATKRAELALPAAEKIIQSIQRRLTASSVIDARDLTKLNQRLSMLLIQLGSLQTTVQYISKIHQQTNFSEAILQKLLSINTELEGPISKINELLLSLKARFQAVEKPSSWERAAPISAETLSCSKLAWSNTCGNPHDKPYPIEAKRTVLKIQ